MHPDERDLGARVAVLEARLEDLDGESKRTRDRLHTLEQERAAIELLMDEIKQHPGRMREIAAQAARDAIDLALQKRDQLHMTAEERNRERRRFALEVGGTCLAVGGFLTALVFHFF